MDLRKEFVHGKPSWERVAVAKRVVKLYPVVVRLLVLYEIYILCIYIVVRRCGSVPRAGAPEATEPPPDNPLRYQVKLAALRRPTKQRRSAVVTMIANVFCEERGYKFSKQVTR